MHFIISFLISYDNFMWKTDQNLSVIYWNGIITIHFHYKEKSSFAITSN